MTIQNFINKKIIIFVLSVLSLYAGDYEKGLEAINIQEYSSAYGLWEPLAKSGDAKSQNAIATIFAHGLGTSKDYDKALFWYKKSANQGYVSAEYSLGMMYAKGLGTKRDYLKARYWLEKSAAKNDSSSLYNLAVFYCEELGVSKDLYKCAILAKKAKENGYDISKFWNHFELDKF